MRNEKLYMYMKWFLKKEKISRTLFHIKATELQNPGEKQKDDW